MNVNAIRNIDPPSDDVADITYSAELILTTVLSLIAASLWIELAKRSELIYFNNNMGSLLLLAVIMTVFAILVLSLVFKKKKKGARAGPPNPK